MMRTVKTMPNRIIKESICYSEDINLLTPEEEIFFYRLIVNCDDYGRTDARLQMLKARLFPLKDNITLDIIDKYLLRLQELGLIVIYENNGVRYLQLLSWERHQQVRAKHSKYPALDDESSVLISNEIICNQENTNVPVFENPIRESNSIIENRDPQKPKEPLVVPYEKIKDEFNKTCISLTKVTSLSKSRKEKIKARWNELKSIDKFKQIFEMVEQSKFLKGANEKGWKATFDWILSNDNNFVKILEGQYANNSPPGKKVEIPQHNNFEQRQYTEDVLNGFFSNVPKKGADG